MYQDMEERLSDLERRLGVRFTNRRLLLQAVTTRSYEISHRDCDWGDNEVLELLGDAVLRLCLLENLMSQFPEYDEGQLTQARDALARNDTLLVIGEQLRLLDVMLLGNSERTKLVEFNSDIQKRIVSCALEAIIGALYKDQGMNECVILVHQLLTMHLHQFAQIFKDYRSLAQRAIHRKYRLPPRYVTLSSTDSLCRVAVYAGENTLQLGKGEASTKKGAERAAAEDAVHRLEEQERRYTQRRKHARNR